MYPKALESIKEHGCACGKDHILSIHKVLCGAGVVKEVPEIVKSYNAKKPFVLCDKNTYEVAGKEVCELLTANGISYVGYTYTEEHVAPNEENVGRAFMYLTPACDMILAVGSGVLNDIAKILSNLTGKPFMIVATAPSMDGYASGSSSMTREGLKISLNSRSADVILGDTDIMCKAPVKMMKSGLGDMLAKYVSICEWRIANLLIGEYYCEDIARLVRDSLKRCVDQADALLRCEPEAVAAVFEGLVVSGIAMNYAGISRPASGVEHYFSHVWDMRSIVFGTPEDLHGIQCAIGTLYATRLYEKLKAVKPDRAKALAYVEKFDFNDWAAKLKEFLGKSADSMIAQEAKEHKYDKEAHKARLEKIIANWDKILKIIDEELLPAAEIEALLDRIEAPKDMTEIGLDPAILPMTFYATKDIRDKYVLPRLAWDLGILEELL